MFSPKAPSTSVAKIFFLLVVAALCATGVQQLAGLERGATQSTVVCSAGADAPEAATSPIPVERTRAMLLGLKLVSYYPAQHAWNQMWTQWDPSTVDADFAKIAGLNANAVRLIVHTEPFGYPSPDPAMLDRLSQAIDLADGHGLKVVITLFDWGAKYGDVGGSSAWADRVLGRFRGDDRIAFVELQNELDSAQPAALAWAKRMVPCVRGIGGEIPISLSVSGSQSVGGIKRLVAAGIAPDLWDLHYYGKASLALATFEEAKGTVGPVPLFIGEAGYSTLPVFDTASQRLLGPAAQEAFQDQFERTVFAAAQSAGLGFPAPWILNDFTPGATTAALDPGQYDYGLYRTDGVPKPAALSLGEMLGSGQVDTSFNNSFECADDAGLPCNWNLWYPTYGAFARDTGVSHTGVASVRISDSSASPSGNPAFFATPVAPIHPADTYTASVWARGSHVTGLTAIALGWFSADNRYLGSAYSLPLGAGDTDWTQLQVSAVAPADAVAVEVHLVSASNHGAAWFDDVSFGEE